MAQRADGAKSVGFDPRAEYQRRLEISRGLASELARRDDLAGNARMVVFVAGVVLAVLAWRGTVGVAWPIVKVCGTPEAAKKSVLTAVWAVSVQVPAVTYVTKSPLAMQTLGVLEVTDCAPSVSVALSCAVNPPPELQVALVGMFMIDGVGDGVA